MSEDNYGVGNCGFIDPLTGYYMDDEKNIPPWWVPLVPAAPPDECQAWSAFVGWLCQPPYDRHARSWENPSPRRERWVDLTCEAREEFGVAPSVPGGPEQ